MMVSAFFSRNLECKFKQVLNICGLKNYNLNTKKNSDNLEVTAFQSTPKDLSELTPNFQKSYNFAAYVNRSESLQNLINLNVNLSKVEKTPYIAEKLLKLDFEKDMKKHILFIGDYMHMKDIGNFITKNPMIFYEQLEDLEIRINYLKSKGFTTEQIKRIICKNPFWLMFSTVRIDRRFGYYQESFDLCGKEIRFLATKQPKIITYNLHHIKTNMFVIKEEMGFESSEIKDLILRKPKLWMISQKSLIERFNFLHNFMQIPHQTILENPEILLCRLFKIKQRHLFLDKLGRAQYNSKKENYVQITALIKDTDVEFCKKYAKCNVEDFNTFLKTL